MQLDQLSNFAYQNAKDKNFFNMEERLLRKMKSLDFDDEEIEYFIDISKTARLMQIVSECCEVYEALRKDDRKLSEKEVADIQISLGTFAKAYKYSLNEITLDKMKENSERQRLHGKKF